MIAIHLNKIKTKIDKPIYLGNAVLESSKLHMYETC